MRKPSYWTAASIVALIVFAQAACNLSQQPAGNGPSEQGHGHEHDNGHAHGNGHEHPAHGPHDGHLVELGEEEYHVEWLHEDDVGKVVVYILDGAAKKEVPIEADQVTFNIQVGETTKSHQLEPIGRGDTDPPITAQFELVDKPLVEALKAAGEGIQATLTVEIAGKRYTGTVEHHDHGH